MDAREVASKLTKAQRTLMLEERPGATENYKPRECCIALGLLIALPSRYGSYRLAHTRFGLAVRAILESEEA